MKAICLILSLSIAATSYSQYWQQEDSTCRLAPKYHVPARHKIDFPAADSSDSYKLAELRKAVPERWYFNPDPMDTTVALPSDSEWLLSRIYTYYFVSHVIDFDEKGDTMFNPSVDSVLYKLKDTYVFDINGDGLPDMIHYPLYYRLTFMDGDFYDIFLKQKDGNYKLIHFDGYICDITFHPDHTLQSIKTFSESIYAENHEALFTWYSFDKKLDKLVVDKELPLLKCQLIWDENEGEK